jgi:hypothetical protein
MMQRRTDNVRSFEEIRDGADRRERGRKWPFSLEETTVGILLVVVAAAAFFLCRMLGVH